MVNSIENLNKLQLIRVSTCGSVDDGKSTMIGRMLYECGAIFDDNFQSLEKISQKKGFEEIDFSLLLDGLSAEREQKITIDVAYRYFTTQKRRFVISDVPGHEQYTRNMVTGISTANVALILIDASKGLLTQTKRHLFIASLLGVGHIAAIINKMDLVDYQEEIYENIKSEIHEFTRKLSIKDLTSIPVCAVKGEMLKDRGTNFNWYKGPVLIDYLENLYVESDNNLIDLRLPVQTVVRPNQNFRGYAGRIVSGRLSKGEKVLVLPLKKETKIKEIIYDCKSQEESFAPQSILITLEDHLDISRGDMIVRENNIPAISKNFQAILFWFSEHQLETGKSYILKQTTKTSRARIDTLFYKFDISDAKRLPAATLQMNDIGKVSIISNEKLIFDTYLKNKETGSFILIDDITYDTVAAGLITQEIIGQASDKENKEASIIWFMGLSGSGKSTLAEILYYKLKEQNIPVEWLDGDDFRQKFNFDLGFTHEDRIKNIERAAYISKMLVRNGITVIGSFITPYKEQRDILRNNFKNYHEIFIDAPYQVCKIRDVKGLYKKADLKQISNFTGLGDTFEKPENVELHLKTDENDINECIEKLLKYLTEALII
jgi:bifunctional enzyme CysN/CysC